MEFMDQVEVARVLLNIYQYIKTEQRQNIY